MLVNEPISYSVSLLSLQFQFESVHIVTSEELK